MTATASTFKNAKFTKEKMRWTANNNMGAAELLRKYLESPAGSDLLARDGEDGS